MKNNSIYVAGHNGMTGRAITNALQNSSSLNIITAPRKELDLTDQSAVNLFFKKNKPSQVILAAARVGGIHANNAYPADFIYDNLMIQANVIHAAYKFNCDKLLFLGSSCIYPKQSIQPINENSLLTGQLEPTNEPYAIAKIAGIKLCESYNRQYGCDFRSVMPTNLYGPNDNFHPDNSHVIPGLIQRIHSAKLNHEPKVEIWGSGRPEREFLHVNDMAEACLHVLNLRKEHYQESTSPMLSHINIGYGSDISIKELAEKIRDVVEYKGELVFNADKPDGTLKKLCDTSKIRSLGWEPRISLQKGLEDTYGWYLQNIETARSL